MRRKYLYLHTTGDPRISINGKDHFQSFECSALPPPVKAEIT